MSRFAIYESFDAFQGEGFWTGVRAFFVRVNGCPVECPWCDSAGTWHKRFRAKDIWKCSSEELAEHINKQEATTIICTGGEPSLYDWKEVLKLTPNKQLHLETCGAYPIKGRFDWLTVSPKTNAPPLLINLKECQELKIIVESKEEIDKWDYLLEHVSEDCMIYFNPEWTQAQNPEVLNAITNKLKSGDERFRAGFQLHKIYECDSLDKNSRPKIPLGGNPELGL